MTPDFAHNKGVQMGNRHGTHFSRWLTAVVAVAAALVSFAEVVEAPSATADPFDPCWGSQWAFGHNPMCGPFPLVEGGGSSGPQPQAPPSQSPCQWLGVGPLGLVNWGQVCRSATGN